MGTTGSSTRAAVGSGEASASARSVSNLPDATDVTTCVNTLFSRLGAPPEHGGELEPAFVMHIGARHASPALPALFRRAGGGVPSANANQIDFRDSPVELYFFRGARAAAAALPAARRELASAHLGPAADIAASGNVIYVERGSIAAKALGAISDCVRQQGGRPIS
jgi:hypothetical protein